jgi:hypothetical protein
MAISRRDVLLGSAGPWGAASFSFLVQGNMVLEAPTSESNLSQRLERAYFGHESHALESRPAAL